MELFFSVPLLRKKTSIKNRLLPFKILFQKLFDHLCEPQTENDVTNSEN